MKIHLHLFKDIVQSSPFRNLCVKLTVLLFGEVTSLIWPSLWYHFQESKLLSSVWSWKAWKTQRKHSQCSQALSSLPLSNVCGCTLHVQNLFLTLHVRIYFLILKKGIWRSAYSFSNITIFKWKNQKVCISISLENNF